MQGVTVRRSLKWTVMIALVSLPVCATSAALERYDFKLRMSEDKKLCSAITEVLSEEYLNGLVQLPPHHEWFIRWNVLDSLGEQFRDEPRLIDDGCSLYRWARFDIDNDGRAELVVKWSSCLGGIRSDTLYIFRNEESPAGIYETIMNKFPPSDSPQAKANQKRLLGQISYTGEWYELKKLPLFKGKRGGMQLHGIGGVVWIHPFVFGGKTYLNLHDLCCDEGGSAWHVIARYRREEKKSVQLEEMCYVERKKL